MADEQTLRQAQALHQRGALAEAKQAYDAILARTPNHFGALLGLGLLAYQTGALNIAEALLDRAATVNPGNAAVHFHRGNLFHRLGRTDEALAGYDHALSADPNHAAAHANRGVMLEGMGRLEEAIAAFDRAIAAKPDFIAAHFNRGNVLQRSGRFAEALESYDRVLALEPGHADAWNNRGNALKALGDKSEALKSLDRAVALGSAAAHVSRGNMLRKDQPQEALAAYARGIALDPACLEAHVGRGNLLCELGRYDEALAGFAQVAPADRQAASVALGRGHVLFELGRSGEAMAEYEQALAREPTLATAWVGRGNVLLLRKQYDAALEAYDKALACDGALENAWVGRGNVFQKLKRADAAAEAYARALTLNPGQPFVKGALLHQKMLACDWNGTGAMIADIETDIAQGRTSGEPFSWQGVCASPPSLQRCAELYAPKRHPGQPATAHSVPAAGKIRLGYLSGEFFEQATSHLLVGVLESHDPAQFEVTAFDNGYDDASQIRRRIQSAVAEMVDIAKLSDDEAAAAIRARGIDILVNLNGYFGNQRMRVFARRPAALQVNYLGFPGTLGADYIDYIVADRQVIPEDHRQFFTEKVAWLPHCYQANDRNKPIAPDSGDRAQHGLPEGAFVFCCFNNSYKIMPATFDCWMRLLRDVPGSVLWLMEDNEPAPANLKKEAAARGVDPTRLIFAPRLPLPRHLARHRLADLFLDTLPYNAHTTASDALWAGLPVLTCRGSAFAGRVAASLLDAIGLPELTVETPEAYEIMALTLAREPARLAGLKEKLAANHLTTPLFDTAAFTRHLEAAFTMMQARRRAGLTPDHVAVPG